MKISDLKIGDKVHVNEAMEAEYDGTIVEFSVGGRVKVESNAGGTWWQDASEITHKL